MTRLEPAPYALDAASVARLLETDVERGLLPEEAAARLSAVGPNELRERPPTPRWRRFALQFEDPLVILLLAATAISALVWLLEGAHGLPIEAIVILAIVVLNAVLGYVQVERAEQAVAALRAMSRDLGHGRPWWAGPVGARSRSGAWRSDAPGTRRRDRR